jgi:hypothetical protein
MPITRLLAAPHEGPVVRLRPTQRPAATECFRLILKLAKIFCDLLGSDPDNQMVSFWNITASKRTKPPNQGCQYNQPAAEHEKKYGF